VLTVKINDTFFTLRTAAVIMHRKRVLLHKAGKNDFWSLPGGRINPMESSSEALVREMREELQVDIQIRRLLWIAEYFYRENFTNYHEIGFYYFAKLPKGSDLFDPSRVYTTQDGATKLEFRWYSIASLTSLSLYPEFLKSGLRSIPEKPEHLIFRDPSLNMTKQDRGAQ
jgi:ADP-ribose pyrophosphatase YjhB (NUDIX family)